MLLHQYKGILYVKRVVNLTDEVICLYHDKSGAIGTFYPSGRSLPHRVDSYIFDSVVTDEMFVVDENGLDEVIRSGRKLDDIAIVEDKQLGRGGEIITYLASVKDPNYKVRLA